MRQILLPAALLILGIAASFALRSALPSLSGWTWTSLNETHVYTWNVIGFWAVILLAAALSLYAYLRRS
jgi:hypothetical protein